MSKGAGVSARRPRGNTRDNKHEKLQALRAEAEHVRVELRELNGLNRELAESYFDAREA